MPTNVAPRHYSRAMRRPGTARLRACTRRLKHTSLCCEQLERRTLLSAGDIDLSALIARSSQPSRQTSGLFDSAGNTFVFSTQIGPKPDEHTSGQRETYVSKVDASGREIWRKFMAQNVTVYDMALGPNDDLWVAGRYDYRLSGSTGVRVWRFAANTGVGWHTNVGPELFPLSDLAVDAQGNAVVTGLGQPWDPNTSSSSVDAFVGKLSSDGSVLWSRYVRGNGADKGHALALSGSGDIVIGGVTDSSVLAGAVNESPGGESEFVTRLNASGVLIGSAYVTGNYDELLQFLAYEPFGTEQADSIDVRPALVQVDAASVSGVQVSVNGVVGDAFVPLGPLFIYGGGGDDRITISPGITAGVRVHGGDGDDTILGGSGDDTLEGGNGADVIAGRQGNDLINGDDPGLYGNYDSPSLPSGNRSDLLEGGEGDDTVDGNQGNDTLYGHDGDDELFGGTGDDELYGNGGDDRLSSGAGTDYLAGNAGLDVAVNPDANDIFASTIEQYEGDGVRYVNQNGHVVITGTEGYDQVQVVQANGRYTTTISYAVIVDPGQVLSITITLLGGEDHAWTYVPMGVTIYGGAGDDYIFTGYTVSGNDLIYGGAGNDRILSYAGNDTIYGNQGDDEIYGDSGSDSIMAGLGNDSVQGGPDGDWIYGGDGTDLIRGNEGDDYIEGRGKADTIYAGAGADTVYGGAGVDSIFGEEGNDYIVCFDSGFFVDIVDGGDGTDTADIDATDSVLSVETLNALT